MSDVYPDDEPGPDTPAWASSSTMAWERVPEQRRGQERWRTEDTDDVPRVEKRPPPRPEGRTYGTPREQRLAREPRGEPEWDFAEPAPPRERPSRSPSPDPPRRDEYRRGRPPPEHATGREWGRDQIPRRGRPDTSSPDYDRGRPDAPSPDYDRGRPDAPSPDYDRGRPDAPAPDYDREPRREPDYGYDRGPEDERAFGRGFVRGRPPGDERRSPPPVSPGRGAGRDAYDSRPHSGPPGPDYSGRDGRDRDYDDYAHPRSGPPGPDYSGRDGRDRDYDDYAHPRSGPPGSDYSGRDNGRGSVRERDYDDYDARLPDYSARDNGRGSVRERDYEHDLPRPRPTSGGGVYGTARTPDAATTGELPNVGDLTVDGLPSGSPFSVSPAGPTYTSAPLTGAGVDGLQATGYMPIVRPGAQGFPPELAALAAEIPEPEPEEQAPDPEQRLAAFVFNFDPDTLREQVEGDEVTALEEIRDQLTDKLNETGDNPTRARLLSLRAVVSRILGDLLKAFADGKLALAHAEATGELRRIAIAQARLAHVLQWREEFEEADRLFTLANSSELPDRLRATMHQHAGKCAYDQGRYMEACNHFESALDLRKEEDPELIGQTALALDAVFRRVAEKDWGPYPRSREEILQMRKPPSPAFDETTQRWGFIDTNFDFCIGPGYVDVQPFRDSVAWVQRQGAQTWELIDDAGRSLIDPAAGYLGVSSFSDGVAWVSRDGQGQWIAIDKTNALLISTGFDEVRPFRRGLAAVRRGPRWGAVDGAGRAVVSFQYDGFATALSDGRFIDGFSDEGLAIVVLGGLKGVVDRTGRVVVPPVHPVLMIHPVAFIIADEASHWGALDRRGRLIIDETFASRIEVLDEIDRLLADTRPVM